MLNYAASQQRKDAPTDGRVARSGARFRALRLIAILCSVAIADVLVIAINRVHLSFLRDQRSRLRMQILNLHGHVHIALAYVILLVEFGCDPLEFM